MSRRVGRPRKEYPDNCPPRRKALCDALNDLHRDCDQPKYRQIKQWYFHSKSTLSRTVSGERCPPLDNVIAYVEAYRAYAALQNGEVPPPKLVGEGLENWKRLRDEAAEEELALRRAEHARKRAARAGTRLQNLLIGMGMPPRSRELESAGSRELALLTSRVVAVAPSSHMVTMPRRVRVRRRAWPGGRPRWRVVVVALAVVVPVIVLGGYLTRSGSDAGEHLPSGLVAQQGPTATTLPPATIAIDPAHFDRVPSMPWTTTAGAPGFGPIYDNSPNLLNSGAVTNSHTYASQVGTLAFPVTIDRVRPGRARVRARLSSETNQYQARPDQSSDVTLIVNGVEVGTETVIPDDGKGEPVDWDEFDAQLLKQGNNTIGLRVKADAANRNGLCVYGKALTPSAHDEQVVLSLYG